MIEEWRVITGFEKYEVSNFGRVKSKVRAKHRILSPRVQSCGYLTVLLHVDTSDGSSRKKNRAIHRLVAIAFIDNHNGHHEVNHKDGDKANNRVENLEWCSRGENIKHSYDLGLRSKPTKTEEQMLSHNRALAKKKRLLSDSQVFDILRDDRDNITIAKELGVETRMISRIRNGEYYKDLYYEFHSKNKVNE